VLCLCSSWVYHNQPNGLLTHAFDAIICQQDKQQDLDGARLLHEAHYLGLLQPGCVLLLLDADQSEQEFLPSDLYFSLYLPLPFMTQQLTAVLGQLVKLSNLTRTLAAPILLREWQLATALCEDLLFQPAERITAAQHYALCANEYQASWPRAGLFYAMLGLGKLQSAQTDLQRHQASVSMATRLELQLASQLHQHHWLAAWETMGELLQIRPHQPRWHQLAMLLGLVLQDEEKVLEQANSLTLRHFGEQRVRLAIDSFMLNASLAVLWHAPSSNRIRSLQQEWEHLKRTVHLQPHEYELLQALMLGLDYRFDEALILIAHHQPDEGSDNHLTLLLGFAVSQFCGLPHHAQRYLTQLTQYRVRVAPHPLTRQLFHHLVAELGQATPQGDAGQPVSDSPASGLAAAGGVPRPAGRCLATAGAAATLLASRYGRPQGGAAGRYPGATPQAQPRVSRPTCPAVPAHPAGDTYPPAAAPLRQRPLLSYRRAARAVMMQTACKPALLAKPI